MADDVKIIKIVVDASAAVGGSREATRALEAIEAQTRKTADTLQKMESGFDVAALATKAFVAAKVVKEVADRLSGLFATARDAASAVSDFSEQLGLSTTYVQAAMFSAAQHTIGLEKLTVGYTKATQVIGQAAGGQKDAIELFGRLGVKILDSTGKLRDSEAILSDAAAGVLKIEDPARRVTAMMDLFGKSGAQLIPMLDDIAGGSAAMAAKAAAAGAIIEEKVIKQLADLKSHAEESALKWNALVANLGAPIATAAMEAVNRILSDILSNLDRLKLSKQEYAAGIPQAKSDVQNLQEQLDAQQGLLRINPNNFSAKASVTALNKRLNEAKGAEKVATDQLATQMVVSGSYPPTEPVSPEGTSNPPPRATGGGESPADKFKQLEQQLANTARAQRDMTDAALSGDQAFESAKATVEAQNKVLEIFKTQLADTDPRLTRVRDLLLDISRGKAAESFALATTELQKQNELLEVENRYLNAAPELRARELAAIKARQEAEKGGAAVTQEMVDARRTAIEQNERLKIQADEIKRSNELWTAPLKTALESIQHTAADMWEGILTNGKFSMQEFGQLFSQTMKRAAAELLALATIRPIIGVAVQGLSSLGVVSPGMASQLGYGSSGGAGGAGGGILGGLGNIGSVGSMVKNYGGQAWNWLGGLFGGGGAAAASAASSLPSAAAGAWGLGGSAFGGIAAAGYSGAAPTAFAGASAVGGLGGAGAAGGVGGLSGMMSAIPVWGWATAAGALLKNLTNGNQSNSLLGMINTSLGPSPEQWMENPGRSAFTMFNPLGPLGMVLSDALGLGLFPDESNKQQSANTNSSLRYGSNGFFTYGGAYGSNVSSTPYEQQLGSAGTNMTSVFDKLGGVKDASKMWGMDLDSWTQSAKNWSYTSQSTNLVDPSGNRTAWRMNEGNMVETASAQVAMRSILDGAVGEITQSMRTAVTSMLPATTTLQDVAKGVAFVADTYDQLGKTVSSIKPDFEALENKFKEVSASATALGLSLAPIDAEQKKQTGRLAQDFIDNLIDPVAVQMRAFDDEKAGILANVDYIKQHTDVIVDMSRINEALLRKEAALKDQLLNGAISQIEDAMKRLMPGGNLANVDPRGTLAGLEATYQATRAQAFAGDDAAYQRVGSEGTAYADYLKSFTGGDERYNSVRDQLLADFQELSARAGQPVQAAPSDGGSTMASANSAQMQQLMATVQSLVKSLEEERAESAKLRAVLSRYVTSSQAA